MSGAPSDIRFHLSTGVLESFRNTLPLLRPRGYLQVQDIFVTEMNAYRMRFHGPGKLDGSIVNWVNGVLLAQSRRTRRIRSAFRSIPLPVWFSNFGSLHHTTGVAHMTLPILPTTVVGSYSMPEWLERLKTDYHSRRISRRDLDEIHDTAVKAAIKDQEIAGIDVITDGELRRDNMIDYFVERLPGVQFDRSSKKFYYDFYDSEVLGKLPSGLLGLTDDYLFLRANTDRETKICLTGPHSLSKRIRNKHYASDEVFAMDLALVMNQELKELARVGARRIQIDEPYYCITMPTPSTGVNSGCITTIGSGGRSRT